MINKIAFSSIATVYIFALNLFSNQNLDQIVMSIWPTLLLFILFLIIGLFHRLFLKLFVSFNILIASIAIFFKWQYGITITGDIILSGLVNDTDLTAEMISMKLLLWVLSTAILPIIAIFFTKIQHLSFKKQFLHTSILIAVSLVTVVSIFFLQGYEFRAKGQIRDPKFSQALSNFSPLDVEYSFNKALRSYKKMKKLYSNIEIMSKKYHYRSKENDLLVVFVLGESTRGDHFMLNGYNRNTTPLLSKTEGLSSFRNVRSCATLTIQSLPCIFSPLDRAHSKSYVTHSPFSEVFHSLGFNTEIYSLQTLDEFYQYLGYDHLKSKYAILNEQHSGAKDISLLPYAKQIIKNYKNGKKLLILHTLGSHQTYHDRITPEQEIFKPSCRHADVAKCTQEELLNAYDNTIIGIDSFLATLINELSDKKAILFYISDHGESLGENGNYFHGKPIDIAPQEQFDVPFIIWFSKKYLDTEEGRKRFSHLKKYNLDTALSSANIFYSVLGCSAIESTDGGIDQSLNICSAPEETAKQNPVLKRP
ncbi:phosphoethanolamine transferase [Sulfurovum sp. NBC37-1]|uniref:phosphoethanolamine transferase n=1 Tax=Sulfurovum sp. (strain NBC37-1) TaxID=387093 RepID=UPI0001587CEA|nr:sulfatase-like hydrolase/transferase [Sulfurovum sp. NBC37-1]BAF72893.1 conserved hypothetical protein [Sulfurovum sp. NBC37-1]